MSLGATRTASVAPAEGAEHKKLAAMAAFLMRHHAAGRKTARLVMSDGEEVDVPAQLFDLLEQITATLSRGDGVAVSAIARELTTTEAAKLLGMSRPTLVRLLENGSIASHRVGSHRRVFLADVLAFRQRQMEERRKSYEALMWESDALGFNDDE
ncbi:helix-turn-helix domain-containing protein [Micromonospora sp. WMMD1128]|uniref:helix-turn-helix domain-containing protein n=1 Tax=unclassified Micromonospora TaxID=2617518 RepID=UPI00248D15C9|nr:MULTISPECIES: helix-turn-helix domain-containing protein [unclassified Micromonospora]WBB74488.1 helix-turn-helix domain-containing protein [Micromonospora sp. WMMD1128]WFE32150.1 helix-turn-helix domain-containing protein [Micromonospora sp. WMMD975]